MGLQKNGLNYLDTTEPLKCGKCGVVCRAIVRADLGAMLKLRSDCCSSWVVDQNGYVLLDADQKVRIKVER